MIGYFAETAATELSKEAGITFTIFFLVMFGSMGAVLVMVFAAELRLARAIQRKDYQGAAKVISKTPVPFAGAGYLYSLGYPIGLVLALRAQDYATMQRIIEKMRLKGDIFGMSAEYALVYSAIRQGDWTAADEVLQKISGKFTPNTAPMEILKGVGIAQAAVSNRDMNADLSLLIPVEKEINDMYRGRPQAAARAMLGMVLFFSILFGALVVSLVVNIVTSIMS